MKYLLLIVALFFTVSGAAEQAFEIPRSSVIKLTDQQSKLSYPVFIKLPRSYTRNKDKTYPVVYLLDGSYAFQVASGATRFAMNSGAMDEAILVAIGYSQGSKGASSRVRDYTPSKVNDWQLETGKAAQHIAFIADVVFEHIKANYRINPKQRTLVGNSLGGLFAAHVLFTQPNMFESYIIGSPSVWFDNERILSQSITTAKQEVRVYLSVGSKETPEFGEGQDMLAGAKKLADKIKQSDNNQLQLAFSITQGAKHSTAFPTTLIQGLDWLYAK